MLKNGIIPKTGEYCEAKILLICDKCSFKYWYFGNAVPEKNLKCDGCNLCNSRKVKRNPRIINRTNPGPYRR